MLTKFAHMQTQPFYLSVAKGEVNNHSALHVFGAVPAMSQNQSGSVWDLNDTFYPWSAFATATTLTIDCDSINEVGHYVLIDGLDENWNEVSELVTLSAQTGNTTTTTFKRVHYAVYQDGVSITNTGNINIKAGATTVCRITAGKGQSLMSVFTIPNGHTGYITKGVMTCAASADATGEMFVRFDGYENFRVGHSFEVSGTGGEYEYDFTVPIRVPAKSDIDVRAQVRSNNARITAGYDLIIVKDD